MCECKKWSTLTPGCMAFLFDYCMNKSKALGASDSKALPRKGWSKWLTESMKRTKVKAMPRKHCKASCPSPWLNLR